MFNFFCKDRSKIVIILKYISNFKELLLSVQGYDQCKIKNENITYVLHSSFMKKSVNLKDLWEKCFLF